VVVTIRTPPDYDATDVASDLEDNYGDGAADTWMEGDICITKDGKVEMQEDATTYYELIYQYLGYALGRRKWTAPLKPS
jgi:hypothetical protein